MFKMNVSAGYYNWKCKIATITKIITNIIFNIRTYLFICWEINFFNLKNLKTNRDCATTSKIIKHNKINLLNNLYKS